jgi:hypothetical protein
LLKNFLFAQTVRDGYERATRAKPAQQRGQERVRGGMHAVAGQNTPPLHALRQVVHCGSCCYASEQLAGGLCCFQNLTPALENVAVRSKRVKLGSSCGCD